jgi:hypothetical protein
MVERGRGQVWREPKRNQTQAGSGVADEHALSPWLSGPSMSRIPVPSHSPSFARTSQSHTPSSPTPFADRSASPLPLPRQQTSTMSTMSGHGGSNMAETRKKQSKRDEVCTMNSCTVALSILNIPILYVGHSQEDRIRAISQAYYFNHSDARKPEQQEEGGS